MLARTAHPFSLAAARSLRASHTKARPGEERALGPKTRRVAGRETEAVGSSSPCPAAGFVCTDDAKCLCPLSSHVTDAERAVMNGISRQAARLTRVIAVIFALIALTAAVLVIRG